MLAADHFDVLARLDMIDEPLYLEAARNELICGSFKCSVGTAEFFFKENARLLGKERMRWKGGRGRGQGGGRDEDGEKMNGAER